MLHLATRTPTLGVHMIAGHMCANRDTARLLLRVLTLRATQKLLAQLQELDLVVASWLSEFCSTHPPGAGDEVQRP